MTVPELTPAQIVIELAVALATERAAHAQTRADTSAKIAQLSAILERERGEHRAFGDDMRTLTNDLLEEIRPFKDTWFEHTHTISRKFAERVGVSLPTTD